jgi:hypothetical protein
MPKTTNHSTNSYVPLIERPTITERRRALVAGLLDVSPNQVERRDLELLERALPQLRTAVRTVPRRKGDHAPSAYVIPYYFDNPPSTTNEICAQLNCAPTAVRNALYREMAALRAQLPTLAPDLHRRSTIKRAATPNDDPLFWDQVDKNGLHGCWLWRGATTLGYGVVKRQGRKYQAHRYAFALAHKREPASNLHVAHKHPFCDRACVNPAHLEEILPGELQKT